MLLWYSQVSRLEKQLQKAQQYNEQQKNIITQLKAQKHDVDQVKVHMLVTPNYKWPAIWVHIDRVSHPRYFQWECNY